MKFNTVLHASAALTLCFAAIEASAAEITIWTARAIATVLAEIGPEFERTTGHKLAVSSDLSSGFARRISNGESFDVVISGVSAVDDWIREGKVVPESRREIARSGIGVGVRAGARKPDLRTVELFKRTLLEARSIGFLRVGSGVHVAALLEKLGIADAVRSKLVRPDSDIVSELVAKGEVELGIVVTTQILTTPGVEFAGPLPPEIQSYLVFAGGISPRSQAPEAAKQLLKFLSEPVATRVIKSQGMEASAVLHRE
jgi:molybdate transport system substrate-binding protein